MKLISKICFYIRSAFEGGNLSPSYANFYIKLEFYYLTIVESTLDEYIISKIHPLISHHLKVKETFSREQKLDFQPQSTSFPILIAIFILVMIFLIPPFRDEKNPAQPNSMIEKRIKNTQQIKYEMLANRKDLKK